MTIFPLASYLDFPNEQKSFDVLIGQNLINVNDQHYIK